METSGALELDLAITTDGKPEPPSNHFYRAGNLWKVKIPYGDANTILKFSGVSRIYAKSAFARGTVR
jgi:hypothetical protein